MARARWASKAIDLTATPGEVPNYLTVGQLSDAIGLAEGTINDSITRTPITNLDNPRSAICEPAGIFGGLPMWSPAQRDKFLAIRARQEEAKTETLEAISVAEAYERKLYSIIEYAAMFKLHDQTLRRAQSQDGTFPRAIARRRKDVPGVPEHLFPLGPMIEWMHSKGHPVPEELLVPQP